ncbi:substrate-binding periplasmic protein [Pseudoalteromonas sp. H105]|uniref:substrate-binding periplasmic protein n=1 Tax=Pseudoalteromonas sp. H105 TaxID=1348393 RepID=UPI001F202409|nr:transporter substrate-binding domain-containing protein [Pseudoalteromonas sp. H105]
MCCVLLPTVSSAANRSLQFNRPADTPQARYVIELMSIAYSNIGYELEVIDFNHQSALAAANNGILDGQLGRINSISQQYKNLNVVNFPLFEFNLILLKNCDTCRFEQLNNIAIQAGYPAAKSYLDNNPFIGEVIRVKSVTAQLNLLAQKKVDGVLLLDFLLKSKHPRFDISTFSADVLVPIRSFHFLHKRHKELIPFLEQQLTLLEEDGTVNQLRDKHLNH